MIKSRSTEDENFIKLIGNPNLYEPSPETDLTVHVHDVRPHLNAYGNKLAGKGYEDQQFYRNIEIFFHDIPNIHVVRDSYDALINLFNKYLLI